LISTTAEITMMPSDSAPECIIELEDKLLNQQHQLLYHRQRNGQNAGAGAGGAGAAAKRTNRLRLLMVAPTRADGIARTNT
jgi:hypothetical protein